MGYKMERKYLCMRAFIFFIFCIHILRKSHEKLIFLQRILFHQTLKKQNESYSATWSSAFPIFKDTTLANVKLYINPTFTRPKKFTKSSLNQFVSNMPPFLFIFPQNESQSQDLLIKIVDKETMVILGIAVRCGIDHNFTVPSIEKELSKFPFIKKNKNDGKFVFDYKENDKIQGILLLISPTEVQDDKIWRTGDEFEITGKKGRVIIVPENFIIIRLGKPSLKQIFAEYYDALIELAHSNISDKTINTILPLLSPMLKKSN